jgi:hypothetical protein
MGQKYNRTNIFFDSGGIIGPFFFRDTVTAHNYLEKLSKEIVPAIEAQTN